MTLEVYNCVNAYFAAFAEVRRMEHSRSRCDEHCVLHGAAYDVSIWPDEAVVSDAQRVTSRTSQDGIFHNDALAANRYRSAFGDYLGSVHNATTRTQHDIAADDSIRGDPRRRVDLWSIAVVFY
jgi:hypothetical protein